MAEPVRKKVPVAGDELEVFIGGRDEPGAGTVCTAHPTEPLDPSPPSPQMRRAMPYLLAFDARPWLGDIRVPTLVLGGADDQVVPPAYLRAVQEAIPGSSLVLIGGAGHVPVFEKPDEVAAAVRHFLSQRVWL